MQRSQRKRSAPSWLKEKPYIKVRFTQDGITSKVTDSSKLKLEEKGRPLTGSLANYSFHIGQKVWCHWKTADEKEKTYFEGEVIELWDDATIVEENSLNSNEEDEIVEGKPYFHTLKREHRHFQIQSNLTISCIYGTELTRKNQNKLKFSESKPKIAYSIVYMYLRV